MSKLTPKERFKRDRRIARFRRKHINYDHMYEEQLPEENPIYQRALCPRGYVTTPRPILELWNQVKPHITEKRMQDWLHSWLQVNMGGEWK